MISCVLRGQMCNQMFQVATTIAHALQNQTNYAFPQRSGKREQFPFMFPHLPLVEHDLSIFTNHHREAQFGIYQPIPNSKDQLLHGYWQSEKYFKQYRKQIIDAFCIPVREKRYDTVSLHVRRTDYLRFAHKYQQATKKYFDNAIDHFDSGYKIVIFSDDLQWCKENFKGDRFEFCEETNPIKSLSLMSACEHHIICNSTYGWWGAWLNENRSKKVICPSIDSWFTKQYEGRLSAKDIPCEDWIQLDY